MAKRITTTFPKDIVKSKLDSVAVVILVQKHEPDMETEMTISLGLCFIRPKMGWMGRVGDMAMV